MTLSKKNSRNITVNGELYRWYLKGNKIWSEKHIAIQDTIFSGQILLLDPYPWDVEIRPKIIRSVIVFALKNGWRPKSTEKPMFVGHDGKTFILLPKGKQYTHEKMH